MAIRSPSPKSTPVTTASAAARHHRSTKPRVSFSQVNVRLYPITLGHNPACQDGPPLSISWDYQSLGDATVEDFEQHRQQAPFRRRHRPQQLYLPATRRVDLLRAAGFSDREIVEAARQAARDRQRRSDSNHETFLRVKALVKAKKAAKAAQAQAGASNSSTPVQA